MKAALTRYKYIIDQKKQNRIHRTNTLTPTTFDLFMNLLLSVVKSESIYLKITTLGNY